MNTHHCFRTFLLERVLKMVGTPRRGVRSPTSAGKLEPIGVARVASDARAVGPYPGKEHFPKTLLAFSTAAIFLTANSAVAGLLTVGPDYKRATNAAPPSYKSAELGS